jgi:hypothetical protein
MWEAVMKIDEHKRLENGLELMVLQEEPKREFGNRLILCVAIHDETTQKQVVGAWKEIRDKRKEIQNRQGVWRGPEALKRFWADAKDGAKLSYAQLARLLNKSVRRELLEGDERIARLFLFSFGMDEDEADEIIKEAMKNVEAGKEPLPPDFPFDKDRARDFLKSAKQSKRVEKKS